MSLRLPLVFLVSLGTVACASGGPSSPLYRKEVGQASGPDAITLAEQVIHRHGYVIDTAEEAPEIRILTHWRPRLPFEDEELAGITSAETRILVVARPRQTVDQGTFYNIYFTMENRLGVAGDPSWSEILNTPMFREYADAIYNDYRQLVSNIGVRRFR
jgi:hypothetical protein